MSLALRKRTLFLSLDAFGTIFQPKRPIAEQYGKVGQRYGFAGIPAGELQQSFRHAFKQEAKKNPNYGKAVGMDASQWWANIIQQTFQPYIGHQNAPSEVPVTMVEELLRRFSSKEGYDIFTDAQGLFLTLRIVKKSIPENANWPWGRTIVNVTSNSDDRIVDVLQSLGVTIGPGNDVDKVTLSYNVGVEKPDAAIFEYAASQAPAEAVKLHIGDDCAKDAVAAVKAGNGWHGLLLDRERKFEEWNGDQEHQGLVKIERDGCIITVLDSLDALRYWTPDSS